MALPSRPQDHWPLVSGDTPPAALLPRKALLPGLVRLLPRSRQRGLEGVGATPKPTIQNQRSNYVSQSRYPHRFHGSAAQNTRHPHRQRTHSPFGGKQPGATSRIRSGRRRRNGTTAFYTAQQPTLPPLFRKAHMFSSKVNSPIGTSSGLSNPRRAPSRCSGQ